MMDIRKGLGILLCVMLGGLISSPAFAQYTTSSISGVVTDDAGNPVSNATVVVVHEPTGTRRETTSQDNGRYRASGLRVGGPYTVTVTKNDFQGDRFEEVYIALQEDYELNVQMAEGTAQLDALEVVGTAQTAGIFSPDYKGTQTTVTRESIDTLPTISRSLNDYARLDPRVTVLDDDFVELSVAGQNGRYNNITIDSVPSNDEFGLESSGLPARNQVISIEAIDEFQINIAPYDVSQANFVGAGINAVTKSGTNEFDGSVYYLFRDDDFIGEDEDGNDFREFEEDIYGFTFGGPILKDKLFFFTSYEHFERNQPGPSDFFMPSDAALQQIISAANGYGFDPGAIQSPSDLIEEDDELLVKLDWNVSNNHRASFQYTKTEGNDVQIGGRFGSGFSFGSYWFNNDFDRDAYVAHLYSDWTPNLTTEFNISYSEFDKLPTFQQRLPQVTILDVEGVGGTSGEVVFGTEEFRHANRLASETMTAFGAAEYLWGNHTLKFGFDYKENDFFNTFVFGSLGTYEFDTVADFVAGNPSFYQYRIGSDPSDPFPAADWAYDNLGFFIQDTWDISYNLTVTYGFRYDIPSVDDSPLYNPLFEQTFGFRNDGTIDGNELFQPRIGFNWDLGGDYAQQIRGGVGLFQGSAAGVWLSNPFTNPGGNVDVYREFSFDDGELSFSADPDNQPIPAGGALSATQDVDVINPNFEQPSVWRANLAYDRELPWYGINMTVEALHSEVNEAIQYEHLNLGAPTGILPDGRFTYYCDPANASGFRCNSDEAFNDVLLLSNTGKGSATNFTVEFSKAWQNGLNATLAYTTGRADDVNPGTSSRAISNWNNRAVFNPNENVSSTSNQEVQERLIAALQWNNQLFGNYNTSVGLFFESRSGRPFSFTFDNDANGDRIFDNDLLFVPNPGDVVFTDPAEEAQFFEIVNEYSCLRQFQGTVVTRNHCKSPNTKSLDLRFTQEFPTFGDVKGEFIFNVLNLGNLIDDDWGHIDQVGFEYVAEIVDYEGLTEDGRYIYDLRRDSFFRRQDGVAQSRWQIQMGLKFKF